MTETAPADSIPARREIVIGLALGLLFLAPLLVYGPIDDEEGALGVFASQVHYAGLFQGRWLFWLNNLGFGTPLPIGQRLDFHPFFALGSLISLRVALSALWIVHVAVMVVYFLRLAAVTGIKPRLRMVLLACYLFSAASVCLFYMTDWVSNIVGWTLYPALVFYLRRAAYGEATTHFWRASLLLGLLAGFWVLNAHPGYIGPLGLVLVVYVFCATPFTRRTYLCLLTSAVIAVAVSAERIYFFLSEARFFPPSAARFTSEGPTPWEYVLAAFTPFTSYSTNLRLPFIGLVLGLAALAAVVRLPKLRDRHLRACAVAFVAAIVVSLVGRERLASLMVVSAVWAFRDPMICFGMLAGGAALQHWLDAARGQRRSLIWLLVVLQVCQQGATVWAGFRVYDRQRDRLQFYRHQGHADGLAGILVEQRARFGPRVYLSGEAQRLARGRLSGLGMHFVTDLTFLGLNPVTAWFKSVSMDRLYPSPTLMHGYITGERDVIDNAALLDVLGINMVMTTDAEGPPPAGLAEVGRMPIANDQNVHQLIVLGNPQAWPTAVLLDPDVTGMALAVRQTCPNDRALCRDYSGFADRRLPGVVSLAASDGRYSARFAAADRERLLFISATYRPEWQARSTQGMLSVTPVADAFLGVTVPPGVDEVELAFVPTTRIALAWVSGVALIALLVTFSVMSVRRRTS